MKKSFKRIRTIYSVLLIMASWGLSSESWPLAVDEKLPLRILKTSDSKKTVLINRGIEDGLVTGDHAKFFLTTGVVARGVLIKASPSRSVWSLYRLTSENDVVPDKVMNLKITSPVKLTKDITKMFSEEETLNAPPEGILLADGADDVDKSLTEEEKKDLSKLTAKGVDKEEDGPISDRTLEFWGMLHFSSLNSTNTIGTSGEGTTGSAKGLDLLLGMEKYFLNYMSWYGKFSLFPFLHYAKQEYSSIEGHTISSGLLAFGGGVNWHFMAPPLAVNRMILFVGPTFGMGSSTDAAMIQSKTANALPNMTGKVSFFSLGAGIKYFIRQGFGLRAMLDYYQRVETYAVEDSSENYTKVVKGPRILFGLSYRF